ncbi:mucin-binding protein [Secundilactobacillus odoratitofui]|uniref:mucin-binding protein n=1 Tax=Secundilactobacillus odoratitofui TaxID=480930 RepID=UPI0006D11E96|nr:hypothetical protein [Secundilactobacillus odoratitofui]
MLPVTDPSAPVIPYVPGLTPVGPDGEGLQPKDPSDPSQGYLPPTPIDPGQSTPINYIANPQLATVTYQDIEDPNAPMTIGIVDNLAGKTGETSAYRTATRIAELVAKGYVLQEDNYPTAGVVFDTIDDNVQAFTVTFTHATATLTPETTVTPGTSVDADNPDGPKWPSGVDDKSQVIRNVSETVTYVDVTGQQVAETHHDSVQFTRTVTVDLVNGTVTPATDWTAQNGDTTFDAVNSPLINGFFASKAVIDAVTNLNVDSPNVVEEVVYKQLGGWVTGEPGIAPVPYPNDPTNAAGTLNPTDPQLPTIPYVPGKTPVGPDSVALTPKNPSVPADGYLPPAPADLSKDTTITYVDNDNGGVTDTGNGTPETPETDGTGATPNTDQPGKDQSGTDTIGEISPVRASSRRSLKLMFPEQMGRVSRCQSQLLKVHQQLV